MFICQSCNKQQSPHTSPISVILETRQVTYPERRKKNGFGEDVIDWFTGEPIILDRGGEGTEIVREKKCCEPCSKRYEYLMTTTIPQVANGKL